NAAVGAIAAAKDGSGLDGQGRREHFLVGARARLRGLSYPLRLSLQKVTPARRIFRGEPGVKDSIGFGVNSHRDARVTGGARGAPAEDPIPSHAQAHG